MNLPHYGLGNSLWLPGISECIVDFPLSSKGGKGKTGGRGDFWRRFLGSWRSERLGLCCTDLQYELGIWIDAIFSLPVLSICLWAMIFLAWWQASVFCRPEVIWAVGNLAALLLSFWLSTPAGAARLRRAEDMAVLGALVVTAGFLGCGLRLAALNDRRRREGQPVWEQVFSQKVPTWPDLVYIELICMLFVLAGLLGWSLLAPAPLEAPANPAITPNPAKAPWYFVGLQELLVYFDATFAGVILPGLMIVGLLLLPFLDPNPRGNGYYTLKERPLATAIFLLGFRRIVVVPDLPRNIPPGSELVVHSALSIRGIAIDGGHNPVVVRSVLDRVARGRLGGSGTVWLPQLCHDFDQGKSWASAFIPLLLGFAGGGSSGSASPLRSQLGRARYWLVCFLLLMMLAVPVKMLLRWLCHLNYLVAMPEYRFNF